MASQWTAADDRKLLLALIGSKPDWCLFEAERLKDLEGRTLIACKRRFDRIKQSDHDEDKSQSNDV